MKRIRLTDAAVLRLRPGVREYVVRDTRVPSLFIRVYPSGTRTFVCQPGEWKQSLGPTTLMTVDEARQECLRLQSEGTSRKAGAPMFAAFAKAEWRESWLPRWKPSTIRGRDRILETQLLPAFGDLLVDRIRRTDIHLWFDDYSQTSPGAANHALKILRHIFNHAARLGYVTVNPAKGVKPNPRPKRTRFLSR
ncbi:MAG: hypothetical protein OXH06_18080, partial [Gemmatimonadetes bacterium]|nr:hypothetical protein [Gemmatimonadota bacterium]